jgi:zinc protease
MEGLSSTLVTAEQVERAKLRNKNGIENLMSSASSVSQALSSASALGDWRLLFWQRDRIQEVTADDVNRVAKTYFQSYNRTLGVFLPSETPQRMQIPGVPSIVDVVKDYKGGEAMSAGEAFDPSPENIDARAVIMNVDGVEVAVLPKKNRGETVSLALTLRYGNEESLNDAGSAASMIPAMLMAGTKRLDGKARSSDFIGGRRWWTARRSWRRWRRWRSTRLGHLLDRGQTQLTGRRDQPARRDSSRACFP